MKLGEKLRGILRKAESELPSVEEALNNAIPLIDVELINAASDMESFIKLSMREEAIMPFCPEHQYARFYELCKAIVSHYKSEGVRAFQSGDDTITFSWHAAKEEE